MAAGRRTRRQAQDVIGVLDVGTAKTVCLIALAPVSAGRPSAAQPRAQIQGQVQVLGIGEQPTRGVTAGIVTDLDAAEQAVRAAVTQAEQAADVVLDDVHLAVACRGLRSTTFTATSRIEDDVAGEDDIDRLAQAGRNYAERDGRTLVHMNCISYRLDDAGEVVADPRGMAGSKLAADWHAVTVKEASLQNLLQVIERAYLSAVGLFPAPLASALAATTEEERQQGVVCIDIGAGTTAIAMFAQGHLLWTDLVPGGGAGITTDLARALALSPVQAEKVKRDCGVLARTVGEDDEATVAVPAAGLAMSLPMSLPGSQRAAMSQAREIVRGRLVVHLRHVAQRIKSSGVARYAGERIVLTGGAGLQPGLRELAAEVFACPVRLAWHAPLPGTPGAFATPAYATATGLVRLALDPAAGVRRGRSGARPAGYLGRVQQWLAESF